MAPRNDWLQLTKVDLLRRTAEDWGTLTHSSFAPDFDGGHWYYQQGSALSALDVHQSKFSEIWRVSQLPGEVLAVARNHKRLHVLLRLEQLTTDQVDKPRPTRWEHWMYHLPGHRLEYRRSLEWQNEPTCWHLDPKGNLVIHDLPESEESSTSLQLSMFEQGHFKWRKPYSVTEHPVHLSHQDGLMILHTQADQGGHIHLLDTQGGAPLAQIRFFKQVHTRFTSEGVLISDELGCVYLLDKKTLRLECLVRL